MPLHVDPNRFRRTRDVAGHTQVQPNPAFLAGAPPDVLTHTAGGGVEHRQAYTLDSGAHVVPLGTLPRQPPRGAA